MGLQNPSASSVLSLTPQSWTPHSMQCLAASIHLCICEALVDPLRRQLSQAHFSKLFLASTLVMEFGDCIWDESPDGALSVWPFLQALLCSLSLYLFLWEFCSPFYEGLKHPNFCLPSSWASCGLWVVFWVTGVLGLISTYQWVHTKYALFWLGYLTQDIFYVHLFA